MLGPVMRNGMPSDSARRRTCDNPDWATNHRFGDQSARNSASAGTGRFVKAQAEMMMPRLHGAQRDRAQGCDNPDPKYFATGHFNLHSLYNERSEPKTSPLTR